MSNTPKILLGKPVVESIYQDLKTKVEFFINKTNRPPRLATILVGNNPASQLYVSLKTRACDELKISHKDFNLDASTTEEELIKLIQNLNTDNEIDAILVQLPLPAHINKNLIFETISPQKDVDAFHPLNIGLYTQKKSIVTPCTPSGIITLLNYYKINIKGLNALVIGRSEIVGKPMATLLTNEDATVTIAHSQTKDLNEYLSISDLIVCAVGKPNFINKNHKLKKDCIIIDVGINKLENGKITGDVNFEEVKNKCYAITPVPGSVGPLTIASLLQNTVKLSYLKFNFKY
jgi:methylenetetrahydrofolate dehydrogenase (NADP+)/methenyltetrahydrofolate cyclohydrolase